MYSARRRTVVGLAVALLAALGAGSGAGTASADAGDVTITADSPSTFYGHSTVLEVGLTNAQAGDMVRWCVKAPGGSDCVFGKGFAVPQSGDVTTFTPPLPVSMPVGANTVELYVEGAGNPEARTTSTVVVKPEKPHITVSMDRKVVAAKDITRKRVNLYAWVGVTGVSESVIKGRMAIYVDGKRATGWTDVTPLAIPGSTNKKPAIRLNIPVTPIKKRGNHVIEVKYQASGAAAPVVGTGVHGSVRRTFQTQ